MNQHTHREVSHEKSTTKLFVGLDVHKDSIAVAYAPASRGAGIISLGNFGTRQCDIWPDIDMFLKNFSRTAATSCLPTMPGLAATGFIVISPGKGTPVSWLHRHSIPKRPGDRVKTDRRDAIMLARTLRAGDLTTVYIPDVQDEAIRDLARAREDAKRDLKSAKHRLSRSLSRSRLIAGGKHKN